MLSNSSLRRLGAAVLAAAFVLGGAASAEAFFCTSACGGGGMLCSRMSVQLGKGCRLVCRADFPEDAVSRRACADDCKATVVADRAACEGDIAACRNVCSGAASKECADEICSVAYSQCRSEVRAATRECVKAAGRDGAAIQACIEPGDALLGTGRAALADCIDNPATGLGTCIEGC
ncbi:MAG: hypothetical protein ABR538_16515 [Candidatus Binatia bacterium]